MANNRFIYPNSDGTASVYRPTDNFLAKLSGTIDEKLIYCANKDLPTGTKYELIDESVDLTDRTFRNAWTYTADAGVEKTSADLTAEQLARHDMTENL